VGIVLKMNSRLREGGYVPFGPFLAAGGVVHLVWPALVWPL
jgi:leader peptidase (prepilin peptidase)/N-methyltransferase